MRLTIPDVIDQFIDYRRAQPVWGSLHIALEDGNIRDCDIDYCIESAERRGDIVGAGLARILREMTRSQRCRVGRIAEQHVMNVDRLA